MLKIKSLLIALTVIILNCGFGVDESKASICTGSFVNPISDVCWECMFPMSIGNIKIGSSSGNPDTPNPSMPIQICQIGNFVRVGVAIGYWEPSYLVDVTQDQYCMVNLGGIKLGKGKMGTGYTNTNDKINQGAFYNTHWYQYPIVSWLNLALNAGCIQGGDFDIAYFSELDASWNDDELAILLAPESTLFANVIAQSSCAVDAISSMFGVPMDALFWCAGSHGSMYPFTGNMTNEYSPHQASLLAAERMAFKMHRQGMVLNTIGENRAVCYVYMSPIMPKSRWRYQMVNQIATSYRCDVIGRTPMLWETGLNIPTSQKNYGYLFWRKRNCVEL